MRPPDDAELLTEYAIRQSEDAFTELVGRNVALVYSAALRQVREPQLAEEVTQAVFIILARKARAISRHAHLSGWLCRVAYFVSRDALRAERRRQHRERILTPMENPADDDWTQIAPLLDEVVAQLNEKDRSAIVLRFYDQKSLGEVGAALGVDADAAQKRVARALEKLRAFFVKRGIDSSAASLAGAISANSIQAVPVALAKTICAVALAKGATAPISTLTLIKGALKIMAWTKTKTAVVAGVAILLATGTTTIMVETRSGPDIKGTWQGALELPGTGIQRGEKPKTRFVIEIVKKNGDYQASGANIDQGKTSILDKFSYRHGSIHGEVTEAKIVFDGRINAAGTVISGTYKEGEYSTRLIFARTDNPPAFPEALSDADFAPRAESVLQGYWKSAIRMDSGPLAVAVKVSEPSPGAFRADFYCPPGDANRQPASVEYDGSVVKVFTMAGYGMFQGSLQNGNTELAGNWLQGGSQTPATFTRAK